MSAQSQTAMCTSKHEYQRLGSCQIHNLQTCMVTPNNNDNDDDDDDDDDNNNNSHSHSQYQQYCCLCFLAHDELGTHRACLVSPKQSVHDDSRTVLSAAVRLHSMTCLSHAEMLTKAGLLSAISLRSSMQMCRLQQSYIAWMCSMQVHCVNTGQTCNRNHSILCPCVSKEQHWY